MKKGIDVIVVGGGIIGLSCAYYLSKAGNRVVVLEKGGFAAGASGSCDDTILFQAKRPGINLALTFESLELYRALTGELDDDLHLNHIGGMVLIENEEELSIMEEFVSQQRSYGLDVEIIGAKEAKRRQPFLSDHIIASTYSKMDGQVDPFRVMRALQRKGGEWGMQVHRRDGVVAIEQLGSGNWSVRTDSGAVWEAPVVVNAAGAWAAQIADMVGARVPIEPKRGQILLTEQLPPIGETNLFNAKYLITKFYGASQENYTEQERRLGLSLALTQSPSNTLLVGSTREFVGFDTRNTMEGIQAIIGMVLGFLPGMKNISIVRAMAGLRPASVDGKMILGQHNGLEGFYTAAGHEGDGIALAPITGKLLASMVQGEHIERDISELSPNRFGGTSNE